MEQRHGARDKLSPFGQRFRAKKSIGHLRLRSLIEGGVRLRICFLGGELAVVDEAVESEAGGKVVINRF